MLSSFCDITKSDRSSSNSPAVSLRRDSSDSAKIPLIDLEERTSSSKEPPRKRIRTPADVPVISPRKSVTVTVKANEVEEFCSPSISGNNPSSKNVLNLSSKASNSDKVIAIIDFLRERRRRPDENIVITCAERMLNMPQNVTISALKSLVNANRITRVKYPSGYSYRYRPTGIGRGVAVTHRVRTRNSGNAQKSSSNRASKSSAGRFATPVFSETELATVKDFVELISPNNGILRLPKMTEDGQSAVLDNIHSDLSKNGFTTTDEKTSLPGSSIYDPPPSTPLTLETVEKVLRSLPHLTSAKAGADDSSVSQRQNGRLRPKRDTSTHPNPESLTSILVNARPAEGFAQLIIRSSGSAHRNTFNVQVLSELTEALHGFETDSRIRAVLISGGGTVFSSGIDLHSLSKPVTKSGDGSSFVDSLVSALRTFLLALSAFPKILIAGVNGPAEGLGTAILPLFDLVYASDTATFHTAYATLGQVPEAGASFTLARKLGSPVANDLLLAGRRLTARQAQDCGFISDVLFPKNFAQEVALRCARIASQSASALEATKCLSRLWDSERVTFQINVECRQLAEIWKTAEFRAAAANYVRYRMDLFI
ncbi:hypothetical protein Aperf_G00000003239 [Anoplocephala perfoliata]